MSGWLWGGRGSVVKALAAKALAAKALAAKARGPEFDPSGCPDVFSSSKLSDVDG